MWSAIATVVAGLIPVLVGLWGPPSPEEHAALVAACAPLPAPGPADKVLAEINKDLPA